MNNPIYILVHMLINFALLVLFARFMMQWAQIPSTHPYMKAIKRLTGVVDIYTKILPNLGKAGQISLAAVVWMLLLYLASMAADAFLLQKSITPMRLFFVGMLRAVMEFLDLLRYVIFASIIASWVVILSNKGGNLTALLMQLAEPIIAPFRRISPNLGMLDLSPILALLSLWFAKEVIFVMGGNILRQVF